MKPRLINLTLIAVGGYAEQFRCAYNSQTNIELVDKVVENTNFGMDVSPQRLAPIAGRVLYLGDIESEACPISGGWGAERHSFRADIDIDLFAGSTFVISLYGYTDDLDIFDECGSVKPGVRLNINNIVTSRISAYAVPDQTVPDIYTETETYGVLKGSPPTALSSTEVVDIFARLEVGATSSSFHSCPGIFAIDQSIHNAKLWPKSESISPHYLSKFLSAYGKVIRRQGWEEADAPDYSDHRLGYKTAALRYLLLDNIVGNSAMLTDGHITFGELITSVDASSYPQTTHPLPRRTEPKEYRENSDNDIKAIMARGIANGIFDTAVKHCIDRFDLEVSASAAGIIVTGCGDDDFCTELQDVLIPSILPSSEIGDFKIIIEGSVMEDVVIDVEFDGIRAAYRFPLFADSLYAPVLSEESRIIQMTYDLRTIAELFDDIEPFEDE